MASGQDSGRVPDPGRIEMAVKQILEAIGEDPNREGLINTPARVARMYMEVFSGVNIDPREELTTVFSAENHQELVMVRDIPFYSMCEHHFLPFHGMAHVAYMPDGKVTGLSKLARLVEGYTKRPQMQERLTTQVAEALMEALDPRGVAVVIEAEHLCMGMRGVKKPGSLTVTSAVRGIFAENAATRAEVFSLLHRAR